MTRPETPFSFEHLEKYSWSVVSAISVSRSSCMPLSTATFFCTRLVPNVLLYRLIRVAPFHTWSYFIAWKRPTKVIKAECNFIELLSVY
jgi:hypothetical protein